MLCYSLPYSEVIQLCILFLYGLSETIDYSSLYYTVGLFCLFIPFKMVGVPNLLLHLCTNPLLLGNPKSILHVWESASIS